MSIDGWGARPDTSSKELSSDCRRVGGAGRLQRLFHETTPPKRCGALAGLFWRILESDATSLVFAWDPSQSSIQSNLNSTTMKAQSQAKPKAKRPGGLREEYRFDYTKAKLNRFAEQMPPGTVAVLLDPDVARVFKSAESVNSVLRALMTTMPN